MPDQSDTTGPAGGIEAPPETWRELRLFLCGLAAGLVVGAQMTLLGVPAFLVVACAAILGAVLAFTSSKGSAS